MAKPVQPPPDWKDALPEALQAYDGGRNQPVQDVIAGVDEREYLHWSDLRHRTTPSGVTPRQVWSVVKFLRTARLRPLERLLDKNGDPFRFDARSDSTIASLHRIDKKEALWKEMPAEGPDSSIGYRLMAAIEEAFGSSAIEGAVTTRRRSAELIRTGGVPRNESERMVLNNFRTLQMVDEWARAPLTVDRICEMQAAVTSGLLPEGDVGRIRRDDDVRIRDAETNEVVFVPPPASELPDRLARLCSFANETTDEPFVHPIVRAILLHHQLAYDHPFGDGNGRTARALFMWGMLRADYRWFRSLSISRAVLRSRARYYRSFQYVETDESDVTYFVRHQLDCIEHEIKHLARHLRGLVRIEQWLKERKAITTGLNTRQLALVEHLLDHPDETYTVEQHRRDHDVSQPTAWKDLKDLTAQRLLTEEKRGRLSVYSSSKKLAALAASDPPRAIGRNS